MEMQDNELDRLFRSKLDDFEAQPSAGVWDGIAGELNAGKRKKALMPFLSIAASILILVVAGVWFIPQKAKVNSNYPVQNRIVKTAQPVSNPTSTKNHSKPASLKSSHPVKLNEAYIAANKGTHSHHIKAPGYIPVKSVITVTKQEASVKPEDKAELAMLPQKEQDIKAVVPDDETPLTIKEPAQEPSSFITKPTLAATQIPAVNKENAVLVKAKHKIRTLGDLINVVVAKVDKRKDKIIEFTDTDDDESNITGVNLGFVKIKKEDK